MASQLWSSPLSEANLAAHNRLHNSDPGVARYQATTHLLGTMTAAKSFDIDQDLIVRDGLSRTRASSAIDRFVAEPEDRAAKRANLGDGKREHQNK